MTRVLEGRVGDRGRKSTLYALANYAGPDGRHTYPSVETLAHDAECSEATVRRDLKALIKDGWIRRGDQAHVAHIRGDRRPVVYDIAMTEETRLAWKSDVEGGESDAAAGEQASPPGPPTRPVSLTPRVGGPTSGTTPQSDTPSPDATGCQIHAHGVSETPSPGVTAVTPEPFEPFEPKPPLPPASGGRSPSTTCTKPGTLPHQNCRGCGTTTRQLADQARIQAEAERRAAEQTRIEAERAERARRREAGRSAAAEAELARARKILAGTR